MENNFITADQARKLTLASKKSIDFIQESIQTMAAAGHNFCAHDLDKVFEPEEMKKTLESEPYHFQVEIKEKYNLFKVSW